jgi:hypothetical protein
MIGSSQELNMKHMEEMTTIYCYGSVVQGRLLTHHSRSRHSDEEGLQRWFPSLAGCWEELLGPPDLASKTVATCSMFRGKLIRSFRFSHWGEYIGERTAPGGGPGGPTIWWRGQGLARATPWCDRPLVPLRLSFGLRLMSGKIGTLAFVSSNSENISCVAFLKHKNSRKQGTGTVASH